MHRLLSAQRTLQHWVTLCICLLVWVAGTAAPAHAGERVVSVPLENGLSIRYLLTQADASQPAYVLVMFPGSEGLLALDQTADGAISLREQGNFLVRSRTLFVDDTFATAIVDAPSDQSDGYSDAFRASPRHAGDIAHVLDDLRQRLGDVKFVLVGTSRGTVSSSFLGLALGQRWDAVIHTSLISTPTNKAGAQLAGFDYNAIQPRQLFVQHVHDGCRLCDFATAQALARGHAWLPVDGGISRGNPCQARAYHGFNGREAPVAQAIKTWIKTGNAPASID
jgi:pimeloyl-ACP methyl ester carboxylesterase